MEILKNFLGGLNTDDSIDFMPDGDYPYLANGIIGKTYNGKTGVLENVLGHDEVITLEIGTTEVPSWVPGYYYNLNPNIIPFESISELLLEQSPLDQTKSYQVYRAASLAQNTVPTSIDLDITTTITQGRIVVSLQFDNLDNDGQYRSYASASKEITFGSYPGTQTNTFTFNFGADGIDSDVVFFRIVVRSTTSGNSISIAIPPGELDYFTPVAAAPTGSTLISELRSPKDGVSYLFYKNEDPAYDTIIRQEGDSFSQVIQSEFLNFANAEINGGGIVGNLLFYSDGNDPKCVHLTRYAVTGPVSQEEILMIKRGPQTAPTLATSLDGSAEDIVRFEDWQFAYLYTYFDGQTSVLSPYSEMLRPVLNSKEYNTITITFPTGDEPELAKEKKLYVRKGNSGTFMEVGSVSRATIGGAFSGSTITFNGKSNGYVLETSYTKQFELIPPLVKTMCLANNRVWLGNYTTGYDKYSDSNITINAGTEIAAGASELDGTECVAGNSAYKYGFILKDSSGRTSSVITKDDYIIKCGNLIDADTTISPGFGVANFDVDLASLPAWCDLVSMVITKDTIKSSYSYGVTVDIDYYTVVPGGTATESKSWADSTTYLKLTIGTSVIDNGVGFLPQEGDIVSFTESDGTEVNLRVESYTAASGLLFCTPYNMGTIAATDKRYFQVYRPKSIDEVAFYEFGADMVPSAGAASGTFTFTDSILSKINSSATAIEVFESTNFSNAGDWSQAAQSAHDWTIAVNNASVSIPFPPGATKSEILYQSGIEAGKPYTISVNINSFTNSNDFFICWLNNSNTIISEEYFTSGSIGTGTETWERVAPSGATRFGVYVRNTSAAGGASLASLSVTYRPMFPVMFIRDGSGTWNTSHGRIFVVSPVESVEKKTFFKHSSPFIVGSQVNGLSEFAVGDESSVSIDAGEIQKLQPTVRDSSQSSVILAICNSDTYSIYVGEARLSQGANSLFASSGVIGDVRRQQAGFGTLHPESVREIDGQVFWWDQLARSYCRYDSNGIFPISNYKCIKHFEDQSLLNDEDDRVVTGYDPFYRMIFVTFANASTTVKKTIGFSIPLNRWVGFYNFAPVAYIQGTNHIYMPDATLNNKILKLSSTTSFNSFYDNDTLTRYKTKVTMPFNAPTVLEWRAFMMQCSPSLLEYSGGLQKVKDSAITVTAYNEEGQSTNILWDEFEPYENTVFGYFPMDANTSVTDPLINGDLMYSQTLSVDIEFGRTAVNQTHNWIKIAKAGSEISTGHSL